MCISLINSPSPPLSSLQALGNLYLIHDRVTELSIWNFHSEYTCSIPENTVCMHSCHCSLSFPLAQQFQDIAGKKVGMSCASSVCVSNTIRIIVQDFLVRQ